MEGISYKETLELVEKFMINGHIRKYCSEICKGKCCENCYRTNPQSCRHHEGRRLSCSIFLCSDILGLFSATDESSLRWLNNTIKEQYYIYRKLKCGYANIYFEKPDTAFLKIVRFPKKIENVIENINIISIKNIMNELIKKKMKIHKSYMSIGGTNENK